MGERITNIDKVRSQTLMIAHAVRVEADPVIPFFAIHPFVNSPYWMERATKIAKEQGSFNLQDVDPSCDLTKPDIYVDWCEEFAQLLEKCNLGRIYRLWNAPWKMCFMKFCGDYLSEKDYADYLVDSWTTEENPNMDRNVSISNAVQMFKKCKKELLMTEDELEHYNSLPDTVEVWRGVANGRVKLGLSWTDNKKTAIWFQQRFGDKNMLLYLKVQKEDIIAYLNRRDEKEIVLDVMKYKNEVLSQT